MADYSLECATGEFDLTGRALVSAFSLECETGVFSGTPSTFGFYAPPSMGTRLLRRDANGRYIVVLP